MSSVKNLKKDINSVLGDVLEECYIWEISNGGETKKSQAVIDDVIVLFDDLVERVNAKDVESSKQHFNSIKNDLQQGAEKLLAKINKL